MSRSRPANQFVLECFVGILIAGVVLGAAVPLLSQNGLMPGWPWNGAILLGTMAAMAAIVTLRLRGSLRRRP